MNRRQDPGPERQPTPRGAAGCFRLWGKPARSTRPVEPNDLPQRNDLGRPPRAGERFRFAWAEAVLFVRVRLACASDDGQLRGPATRVRLLRPGESGSLRSLGLGRRGSSTAMATAGTPSTTASPESRGLTSVGAGFRDPSGARATQHRQQPVGATTSASTIPTSPDSLLRPCRSWSDGLRRGRF